MWRILIRYLLAAFSLSGACLALLFATASLLRLQNTAKAASAAYSLVPFNADYATRLAGWKPEQRTHLLQKAAHLNPFEIQAVLQLGFDSEFRDRDPHRAETFYLQAEAVDKMFLPKWTLANFYFRQGDTPKFLRWAKAALAITPYSPDPIFAEIWVLAHGAEQREAAIPDRPGILEQYLMFLFRTQHWDALPSVLERLVHAAGDNSGSYGLTDVIGPMLDRLLGTGNLDVASRMWSTLSRARWIPFPSPDAFRPVTNGEFKHELWSHGFDWILSDNDGVRFSQDIRQGDIQFSLSGDQAEDITLVQQWLPLAPNQAYRLTWTSLCEQLGTPSGISWHVQSGPKQADSADFSSNGGGSWAFETGGNGQASLISLHYRRPLGSTRAHGTVRLMAVSLQKP